jgi:hypothetical protein
VSLHRARFASGLLALLLPLCAATPVRAAQNIEVRTASVNVRDDVFEFSVRSDFPPDEKMRATLSEGATVYLDLQATVSRKSRLWFDAQLVEDNLRRELSWNALSQRFVLREIDSDQQQTFATLDEALVAGGTVENWPVQIESLLPDATYEISVRARLRRGSVPSALRALKFWARYWSRSEWHTWVLPR